MTASGLTSDSPPDGRGVADGADGVRVGSVLAGYRLEEQIGRGGMAVVFRASDERLGRQVAVKILAPALGADKAFRRRFVRESRAAALVDDPHIIPIFQAGESDGLLFIAMRLVSGGDVRTLVRQHGSLPAPRAAAIVSPIASALDAAHAAGLVHRDVKPANMLLDVRPGRPDHVYLSDFGLSKGLLGAGGLTGSDQFLGTVDYAAPEQLAGKHVDGRADQYALGCTAFELLSGQPPYRRDQGLAVIYAHMTAPPPQLTRMRPDLPAEADDIFMRVLAKDPAARYGSCQEFADALRLALGLGSQADETGSAMLTAVTGVTRPAGQDGAPAALAGSAGTVPDLPATVGGGRAGRKRRRREATVAPALAGAYPGTSGPGTAGPAGPSAAADTVQDGQPALGTVALAGSSPTGPVSVPPGFGGPGPREPARYRRMAL